MSIHSDRMHFVFIKSAASLLSITLALLSGALTGVAHADQCEDNRNREYENFRRRMAQCEAERGTPIETIGRQFDFGSNCRFTIPDIRCDYGDSRGSGQYGNYANNSVRERALDGNCAYATEFDAQGGYKCRKAEITVKEVRDRGAAMQQVSTIGAAAVQVQNSMNVPRDQAQALKQTQSNMKISMAVNAVEIANNLYGARELKGAESEARSAERGIKNARTAYTEAVTEARTRAGANGANFTRLLSTTNNTKEMKDELDRQARRDSISNGASIAAPAGEIPADVKSRLDTLKQQKEQRLADQKEAVNVFEGKLKEAGLDETARGFNTFESMNSNTRRGIRESQEVAQQAGAAASTSTMQALGNALQLAQTYAAYRQTKQNTAQLASLPNTPAAIALASPGQAPTLPGVTGGSIAPTATPELDNNASFSPATPMDRMRGNVMMGGGSPGAAFKGRKAEVSSGGGGRGLSGGGGGGGNNRDRGRGGNNAITSMDYDSSGGGRYINNAGGGGAQGNSDMQDALAAILGGGEQNADERSKEFREIASVEEGGAAGSENGEEENRTIFERVSEKYGEVISRGDIRLSSTVPAAG